MNVPGFIEERILGKGSYGKVYKAKRISDGQFYAVKVIHLRELNQREIIDSVNEIRLMASLTSPYIITFYQAFCDNKRLCIVSEYSRLGDLAHLIERRKRQNRPLQENDIWRYLIQILEGLKVLHTANVVHRDIKSANILISAPDLIKIADLGISTVLHQYPHYVQLAKTQIGTPLYIAPEIWKKRPYDSKCDIWSLGVLLYEMMTFTFPFLGRSDKELTQRVCSGYYVLPKGYSSDLVSVLRRLLQVNPNNRPSVNDLLKLKCIKDRAHLINKSIISGYDDELKRETIRRMIQPSPSDGMLLSTIKITRNLKNMNFPKPMYGKRANIVRPLEQRMHLKQGATRKDIRQISSPELKDICDKDWWSPNKLPVKRPPVNLQLEELEAFQSLDEKQTDQQNKNEPDDKTEQKNKDEQKNKEEQKENSELNNKQHKPKPQLPNKMKQAPPRPIYKINNENNNINAVNSDSDKKSKSDQAVSPSSSYKSDSSSDQRNPNTEVKEAKRLISIGNGKIRVPESKIVRHGNPRVRKYRK